MERDITYSEDRILTQMSPRDEKNKIVLNAEWVSSFLYSLNSRPFGLSFGEWTGKWWQWLISIPAECNPANDFTGKDSDKGQQNPNVWFLAGTNFPGSASRRSEIPQGKAILFPVITASYSFADDPSLKTEDDLFSKISYDLHMRPQLTVTINGIELKKVDDFRVKYGPFDVVIPEKNLYRMRAGTTTAVSDGYWIFLKPPCPGNYIIHFKGREPHFHTEVTYDLHIKSKK